MATRARRTQPYAVIQRPIDRPKGLSPLLSGSSSPRVGSPHPTRALALTKPASRKTLS